MTDLSIDGLAIAPGVVETIVSLAASSVDGVQSVGDPTTSGIMSMIGAKPSTSGVDIEVDEDNNLHATVRLFVQSGHVLPDLASEVRSNIADAVHSQTGMNIASVDVFIDGISFNN